MRPMLWFARAEHIANPDMGMRRPQLEPGAKLIVGIAVMNLQGRVRNDLSIRPMKFFKQLRLEALRQHTKRFQNQLLARVALGDRALGLPCLQDRWRDLEAGRLLPCDDGPRGPVPAGRLGPVAAVAPPVLMPKLATSRSRTRIRPATQRGCCAKMKRASVSGSVTVPFGTRTA